MTGAAGHAAAPPPRLEAPLRLVALDRVGSTNDVAKDLARSGAPHGTVVWARRQDAGRGRRGRPWTSAEGNLFASFLLRPDCPAGAAAQVGFAAALAVAETADAFLPPAIRAELKWPNDVLASGRKLSGILLESEPGEGDRLAWIVVGIGVNVRHHPEGTDYPATSLAASGAPDARVEPVLERLAERFFAWLARWSGEGFAPVRAAWLGRARGVGAPVTVRLARETFGGTFVDLDADGALLVETPGGRRRVAAGDVFPAGTGEG